jgi:hypothetical protein
VRDGDDTSIQDDGSADAPSEPPRPRTTRAELLDELAQIQQLHDLTDDELVDRALAGEAAALTMLRQVTRGLFVSLGRAVCIRMGHLGEPHGCPGYGDDRPECDRAFLSAIRYLESRTYGSTDVLPASGLSSTDVTLDAPRTRLLDSFPTRKVRGAGFGAFVGAQWRQGLDTEVRRRWNADRGLLQRIRVPKAVQCEADAVLTRLAEHLAAEGHAADDVLAHLDATTLWAQALYDDACDWGYEGEPILHGRVARHVVRALSRRRSLDDGDADRLLREVAALADRVDGVLELASERAEAGKAEDERFHHRYFGRARALTRHEARVEFDDTQDPAHD